MACSRKAQRGDGRGRFGAGREKFSQTDDSANANKVEGVGSNQGFLSELAGHVWEAGQSAELQRSLRAVPAPQTRTRGRGSKGAMLGKLLKQARVRGRTGGAVEHPCSRLKEHK